MLPYEVLEGEEAFFAEAAAWDNTGKKKPKFNIWGLTRKKNLSRILSLLSILRPFLGYELAAKLLCHGPSCLILPT